MNINRFTYTEYFLLYIDNELGEKEKLEVERFLELNPDLAGEMELLKGTTFVPDHSIVFPGKTSLFKKEEKEKKVIPFFWSKLAVAAILLISLGIATWKYAVPASNNNNDAAVAGRSNINNAGAKKKTPDAVQKPDVAVITPTDNRNNLAANPGPLKEKLSLYKKPVNKTLNQTKEKKTAAPINDDNNSIETLADNEPVLKPVSPENTLAVNDQHKEDVKNSVPAPERNIEQLALNAPQVERPVFKSNNDDDMIYFANTSFHKRTKFREVFRKASRVIEKVTSIGSANDASTQ